MVQKWILKKERQRKALRRAILRRDGYMCRVCDYAPSTILLGKIQALHIHHIDKNRKNNEHSNLITLCPSCHSKLHHKARKSSIYRDGGIHPPV